MNAPYSTASICFPTPSLTLDTWCRLQFSSSAFRGVFVRSAQLGNVNCSFCSYNTGTAPTHSSCCSSRVRQWPSASFSRLFNDSFGGASHWSFFQHTGGLNMSPRTNFRASTGIPAIYYYVVGEYSSSIAFPAAFPAVGVAGPASHVHPT